jgi:predicted permease
MLSNFWGDVRYALRSLLHSPGFAAAAIVTIALGIGVNAGVFTVLNGVLFRELPVPRARELVSISQTVAGVDDLAASGRGTFSAAEYRAYREGARTLSGLAATATPRGETTLGGAAPRELYGALISCNYFDVLDTPAALGRALTERDCELGADPVVMLGHELWSSVFDSNAGIVGRTIELNRQRFTVIGVAAERADTGGFVTTDYFAPLSADPLLSAGATRYGDDKQLWVSLLGRRADGVGADRVRAELEVIAAQLDALTPGRSTALEIRRTVPEGVPGQLKGLAFGAAAVLMGAFGLILLMACANVANLLLARGIARSRDLAIRLSLGASRARVVSQLLIESTLISIAGGALGSVLALWSFQALVALAVPALVPPELSFSIGWDLSPDWRVVSFASALTLGSGLLFGLAPALHVSKPDLHAVIKQDSASAGGSRRSGKLRALLVGVQVALCVTLTIASGLLLRGLYATYTLDPQFDYRNTGYVFMDFERAGYSEDAARALRQRLTEQVQALPETAVVAHAMRAPLAGDNAAIAIRLPGEDETHARPAELNAVDPGYFAVLGTPLVAGRTFTESEVDRVDDKTRPAIVTETTARNLWPGSDALDRTLLSNDGLELRIVGVAADAQLTSLGTVDPYYVYLPARTGWLMVKSRLDFEALSNRIRTVARTIDPGVVAHVVPLAENVAWWRGISGTVTALAAGLGALALALASVGIYGVVSYAVTRRYREIGIRLALGGRAPQVMRLILRQTMRPVAIGATAGIAAATGLSSVLSSVLFGVSPADPFGIGGAALVVLGAALAAGVTAAGRATHTDATVSLRYE